MDARPCLLARSRIVVFHPPHSIPVKIPVSVSRSRRYSVALLGAAGLCASLPLFSASGQWATTANGGWGAAANWAGGVVADGVDSTATFDTEIARTTYVGVDAGRTIGHLVLKGKHQWQLNGQKLTLAVSGVDEQPTITVLDGHQFLSCGLAGSQGFVKRGQSNLYLAGDNTYTGSTFVAGGQIYVVNPLGLGATGPGNETVVTHTGQLHLSRGIAIAEEIVLFRTEAGSSNQIYNDSGSNRLSGPLALQRGGASDQAYAYGMQITDGGLVIEGPVTGRLTPNARPGAAGMDANIFRLRVKAGAWMEIKGVLSDGDIGAGGVSLNKIDEGVLRLSSAGEYTGSTVIGGGLLLASNASGSATGAGPVLVNSGGVLGGAGVIAPGGKAGVTVASGAVVAPGETDSKGAARAEAKALTIDLSATTGRLVFQAGAKLRLDLNPQAAGVSEKLVIKGTQKGSARVQFNDTAVDFSVPAGAVVSAGVYPIVLAGAPEAYSGRLVLGSGLEGYDATLQHDEDGIRLRVAGRR